MATKKLWKTTIVIWTEWEPTTDDTDEESQYSIEDLAAAATDGDAYCSKQESVEVDDPASDPDWDGTEFFEAVELGGSADEPEEDDEPIHNIDSNNKWGSQ